MESAEIREINGLISYISSIDWTDPWLTLLLIFHGSSMATTLLTRNYGAVQSCLFLAFLSMVYFSEQLNELGAKHWRSFSRQQYFDSNGMFISLVFSMPLLFNCLLMVCYWLWTSGTLLIKLKRAQLRANYQTSVAQQNKDK